ncbi:hypothetical protein K0M31_008386 [Melipona bicolor]|uniref:Uncharacterized protein n=1 Tax=Melipona bicolor TaxID=60889 RepID=A0AA40FQW0_9HYME|nr:hypothetical protein K0M31_008386 [Melipona bicolor]
MRKTHFEKHGENDILREAVIIEPSGSTLIKTPKGRARFSSALSGSLNVPAFSSDVEEFIRPASRRSSSWMEKNQNG